MSLEESVHQWVIENLPDGSSKTEIEAVKDKTAHQLLVIYLTWMDRRIQPIPRKIKKSSAYEMSPYLADYRAALSVIEHDIRNGSDLTKYLSRIVKKAVKKRVVKKEGTEPRDIFVSEVDCLLSDWGVHHLHLSTDYDEKKDGFVGRTTPLLFAYFRQDTAFFIGVYTHDDFGKKKILDILVKFFPDAGHVRLPKEFGEPHTEEQTKTARKKGVNLIHKIGQEAFMGGGYNILGQPIKFQMKADKILIQINDFETQWENNEKSIRDQVENVGQALPDDPHFSFSIDETGPLIVETVSQIQLRIFQF